MFEVFNVKNEAFSQSERYDMNFSNKIKFIIAFGVNALQLFIS